MRPSTEHFSKAHRPLLSANAPPNCGNGRNVPTVRQSIAHGGDATGDAEVLRSTVVPARGYPGGSRGNYQLLAVNVRTGSFARLTPPLARQDGRAVQGV